MGTVSTAELPTTTRPVEEPDLHGPVEPPEHETPRLRRPLGYSRLHRLLAAGVTGAFLLMLLAGQYFAPANSDSIAQQNILRSLLDGRPRNLVVPNDTWWLHLPIYLLTSLLPNGAVAAFFDVLLTNAVLLVGLLIFTRTYLRQLFPGSRLALTVAHLIAAWFLGLAVYAPRSVPVAGPLNNQVAVSLFLTPNHRNMETGIALLLLAWFAWWARGTAALSRRRQAVLWLLAGLSLGAVFYSDPFFLYTLAGSLVVTCAVFWLTGRWSGRRAVGTASVLLPAAVTLGVVSLLMRALGVHAVTATESSFTSVHGLGENLLNVVGAYTAMFRSYVWGLPIGASSGLVLVNAVLAISVLAGLVTAIRSQLRTPDAVRLPGLLFVVIGVGAYAFSTLADRPEEFRYIFVPVIAALPFATDSVVRLARLAPRWRQLVLVALCGGLLANVAVNASVLVRQAPLGTDRLYAANQSVIHAVEKAGYTKGYASYWNANINTYLSSRHVTFLPITYDGTAVEKFDFLINTPDYDVPARSTFVYIAPTDGLTAATDGFTLENVLGALGEPDATEHLGQNGTLLFYHRDIGSGMRTFIPEIN
jgi:hypothetical protein